MRFLIAICLIAYASALDCSTGQATWCSSLRAAKECGAVNHCKDTVWKNVPLNQDSSDVCSYCESLVGDVQKMLTNKESLEQIQAFLESACSMIPDSNMRSECNTVVTKDLPELLMLISAELDPQLVCSTMGLCRSAEIFSMQPQSTMKKVEATGDICADCKTFFGDIQSEISSKTTEDQLIQQIDDMFCSQMGELESTCKTMVAAYIPELMQMLASNFDPSLECSSLGFCPATSQSVALIPTLRLTKSPLFARLNGQDNEYCDDCKLALTEAKTFATSSEIESEIETLLNQLCNNLGDYKDVCVQTIKAYLPEIMQLIASELDPEADCKALGLCTAEAQPLIDMVPAAAINHKDVVPQKPTLPKVGASVQCVLCEYVMSTLDNQLSDNATEKEIIAALDKVCSILPATITAECQDFVNLYGKAVLILLQQELDPATICTALGLCSSATIRDSYNAGELCLVCETLVQYLDSLLAENATAKEIQQELDKVCNFLPDSYKSECDSIVTQYAPMLIQLLQQELTPNEVCTAIKLCDSDVVLPTKAAMLGESECSWGPAYWCASKQNADRCNAAAHCENHVWN